MKLVEIYCDGSVLNNGQLYNNVGGWSAIIKWSEIKKVVSGAERNTTNNRMEMMPLVIWLPKLMKAGFTDFKITTDSMYVIYGIRGRKRWLRKTKNWPNQDLCRPLFAEIENYKPQIKLKWVKGHKGHPENEEVNALAASMSAGVELIGFK